jgi:hypothetical protein
MMSKTNDELDITPLLAIQHVHRDWYGIIKMLEVLFSNFESMFPHLNRNDQFLYISYVERLIIQNACQYVEGVGSYSVACKETGLLYAERVVSVKSGEINDFYGQVHKLTDGEILKMFNIHPDTKESSPINCTQIREKYKKLKEFRNKYQGLYNAMKHGNRILCYEISKKDVPMDSLHGRWLAFTWIETNLRKLVREKVKAWDGSEIEIELGERKPKNLMLPSDDISEFVNIAKDCHQIIEQILKNNAPRK